MATESKTKSVLIRMPIPEWERLEAAVTLTGMKQNDLCRTAISAYIDAANGTIDPAVVLQSVRQSYATQVTTAANYTQASPYQDIINKLGGTE